MEPLTEALRLLQRQAQLVEQMYRPGGGSLSGERELLALRQRLQILPAAAGAVLETARRLHRPVDTLSVGEIERTLGITS